MRILRFRAYYEPEITASNHLSHDINEAFRREKIVYINYTPMPTRGVSEQVRKEYKKRKLEVSEDGYLIIHRFSMFKEGKNPLQRAIRYLFCNIVQYQLGTKEKDIDLVYSSSTPPTQGMLSALVAKRLSKKYGKKVPFVYNLQDIFPDSLVTTGLTRKGSVFWKIGRKMEDYTYSSAEKIIVISESMKHNIMEKGVPEEKIEVVSNWVDTNLTQPVPKNENCLFEEFGLDRGKFTVVYAGNFGAAQGAEVVLSAADLLKGRTDIQFVIFGGGVGFDEAKKCVVQKGLTNVTISDLLPQSRVSEVYSLGDVALITCKAGVGNSGMPSKTWSIMACGTPIIASFDTESELNDVLTESGAGLCVKPGDAQALATAIVDYKKSINNTSICGRNIRNYVLQNASKDICVGKYLDIINESIARNK